MDGPALVAVLRSKLGKVVGRPAGNVPKAGLGRLELSPYALEDGVEVDVAAEGRLPYKFVVCGLAFPDIPDVIPELVVAGCAGFTGGVLVFV